MPSLLLPLEFSCCASLCVSVPEYRRARCCRTNQLKHQKPGERIFYEAIRKRHTASPGHYQCLAQAIQPDQTSSRIEHAPTRPINLIRETKNQWANLGGWTGVGHHLSLLATIKNSPSVLPSLLNLSPNAHLQIKLTLGNATN